MLRISTGNIAARMTKPRPGCVAAPAGVRLLHGITEVQFRLLRRCAARQVINDDR
jgi:hypothetical protein